MGPANENVLDEGLLWEFDPQAMLIAIIPVTHGVSWLGETEFNGK